MPLKQTIDWLGKNLGRIKTTGLLVTAVFSIFSLFQNGFNKDHIMKLTKDLTGISVENTFLNAENRELTKKLKNEQLIRIGLEDQVKEKDSERSRLIQENMKLKTKLTSVPLWLLNIPADSSYRYLQEVAYPFSGELKYPFNEPQVRMIHRTFLENNLYVMIVDTMEKRIENCEETVALKDSLNNSLDRSMALVYSKNENLKELAVNQTEARDIYKKEAQRQNRKKILYKATTIASLIAVIVLLL